jgi:hypothetical protein
MALWAAAESSTTTAGCSLSAVRATGAVSTEAEMGAMGAPAPNARVETVGRD